MMLVFCLSFSDSVHSQTTSSPYSILGIGDIETKDFGRWFGMGSTGIALKNKGYINSLNPASLMGLEKNFIYFDIASRGRFSEYTLPGSDSSQPSNPDMAVRRITFACRPDDKCAFAFGLKPFSTVDYYFFQTNTILDNKTELTKIIDGSGGIYQMYGTYARKLSDKVSIGFTASYLFGSLVRNTQYMNEDLSFNIERNEYDRLSSFQLQAGLQYSSRLSKKITQHFGLTLSSPAVFKRAVTSEYKDQGVVVYSKTENKEKFYLPLAVGAGYALQFNNKITLSGDVLFSNWKQQKIEYYDSYTKPSQKISLGFEYSSKQRIGSEFFERWYLQFGISAETNYFYIAGKPLRSTAFTFGTGRTFSPRMSGYFGLEVGNRGGKTSNQISERFAQVMLGITLKEFWYNPRKFRKYN